MKIGCVKELKKHEYRVGLIPNHVMGYVANGHEVYIEQGAGVESGFEDHEYAAAGAIVCEHPKTVWENVDMMVKVKEPLLSEYQYLRENLIIYTYLHLAADRRLTLEMLKRKVIGVAYETITDDNNQLPLLKPMSEVAGRLSIQEGAKYLERHYGGSGVLLAGVPGVARGKIVILGGGVVGTNAAKMAIGIGADVVIIDRGLKRLQELDQMFGNGVQTLYSTEATIAEQLKTADLVIGAVLVRGGSTPKIIKRSMLKEMKPGSVIIDVAIDQGGCAETSEMRYHDDPIFKVDGIVHYCVGNMPGATPRTSTQALTNATYEMGLLIANEGIEKAARNVHLARGINTYQGHVVYESVAQAHDLEYVELASILSYND